MVARTDRNNRRGAHVATTTRRRSITQTHERISQLGWEPEYHQPVVKYPTRYTFPKKAKDPMKHIMREYLPMELEKDERVYGGHGAAGRADMPHKTRRRCWRSSSRSSSRCAPCA